MIPQKLDPSEIPARVSAPASMEPPSVAGRPEGLIRWCQALRRLIERPTEFRATFGVFLEQLASEPSPAGSVVAVEMLLQTLRSTEVSTLTFARLNRMEAILRWLFSGTAGEINLEVLRRELEGVAVPAASSET